MNHKQMQKYNRRILHRILVRWQVSETAAAEQLFVYSAAAVCYSNA